MKRCKEYSYWLFSNNHEREGKGKKKEIEMVQIALVYIVT